MVNGARASSEARQPGTAPGPRRRRGDELRHVAFPLGGIGTGSISIDGGGRLRDFEIFNRPAKGLQFDSTMLALWTRSHDGRMVTRLVQGPMGGDGLAADVVGMDVRRTGVGLPHLRDVSFTGRFPFAELEFTDPSLPVTVALEVFSPFIPLEPDDSGLPVAILNVDVANPGREPVDVRLYASLENRLGHPDVGGGRIEHLRRAGIAGVAMSTTRHPPDSARFGTLALVTPHRDVVVATRGHRGSWFDSLQAYWDQVSQDRFLEVHDPAVREAGTDIATIGLSARVEPGETVRLPVWLTWHVPNFEHYWTPTPGSGSSEGIGATWRNHYAVRFADAVAVAEHLGRHHQRLEAETRRFADALWSSSVPSPVMDAVASQLSTLRTPTSMRLEDGTFYGWEGCATDAGSCDGTCSHVWNYAQALPYLFPTLERSIRDADYRTNLHDDGHMTFRTALPLGVLPDASFHAAADGQLGGVLRTYRDWLISGDDAWLAGIWPAVRRSLEYAWVAWDADRDGVPEGLQHVTYDIELYGPNPLVAILYLAALRAAATIATRLGDFEFAATCRDLGERGAAWVDGHLFNGTFFTQQVRPDAARGAPFAPTFSDPDDAEPPYQHGAGCLSDQLLGQWYAHMLGLGHVVDPAHASAAAASIMRNNWRAELWDHANPQRIFALEDEGGLLLATWPDGGRPARPFPYSDEVWTGIEYEVAALLAYEGMADDALRIVTAARDRYDGRRRNPWGELECGTHYARAMASYSLLLAWAGFRYEASDARLVFRPLAPADAPFSAFFSVGSGWGRLRREPSPGGSVVTVEVLAGTLALGEVVLGEPCRAASARMGPASVAVHAADASERGSVLRIDPPVVVTPAAPLEITLDR